VKYAWIKENKDSFPVTIMLRVMGVSKSGYYKWRRSPPSSRRQRTERLRVVVKQVFEESNEIYGSRKIAKQLQADDTLEAACRNTVASAMQEMNLKSRVCKEFKPTTTQSDPTKSPAENLLAQDFTASQPNQKWVTDIMYLATSTGWVYLAVVLDLFSRKAIGWAVSESLATPLVSQALMHAVEQRCPDTTKLMHHSDRGCQYTSDAYQKTLRTLGITCSMSRTGCCYDNAVMERFFWSLKNEWTNFDDFEDIAQARLSIFKYIETFYNSIRIHQTLNYITPNQFEKNLQNDLAA
jgi:putative transposase